VDPERLTGELGDSRVLNVALLGVLSTVVDLPETSWRRAIKERVPDGFFDLNWKAFGVGKSHGVG
jgi:indolepyruvate ferredoxin oxidoreductase beta subunit